GSVITPILTAPTCITNSGQISVVPNTATNTITWAGPGITSGQGTATININAPGLYSVSITNTANACAGTGTIVVNQTPTVNLSLSSSTFCSQNFNSSPNTTTVSATGASSYTWSASAGLNFTGNSTGGPFTVPSSGSVFSGTYTIGVIGSNGVCTNSAVTTVSVIPNPTVTAAPAATSICQGTAYTFTANGAFSYTWFPGTGLNTTNGSIVTANPNSTSTYSVIGQVGGCFSSTQSVTLTVLPNPTVTLGPPSPTICAGSSISLNANGATAYTWSPAGSLSTSLGSIVTAAPSSNQTYTVIGSMNTCTGTSMITLTVIPVPSLNVSATQGTICQGSSTYLSVNGATTFSWMPSAGLNITVGTNVVSTPSVSTIYTVVGNNGLCTGSASYSVFVVPRPDVDISSPNTFICEGTSTQLFATGAQNFDWSPASSLSSPSGSVVTATPLASTNYSVVGYNTLGSVTCSEAHSYSIVVIPNAQALVSPPAVICKGDKTTLTVGGGSTFTWTPSLGLSATTGSIVIASPDTTSTYTVFSSFDGNCGTTGHVTILVNPVPTVYAGRDTTFNLDAYKSISATGTGTLTWIDGDEIWCRVCPETQIMPTRNSCYTIMAENEFGCKSTDEVCVEVTLDFGVYIPNVITPNGDGLNDEFFVYGYGITNVHVNVFDRWGEKLFTSPDQTVGWNGTYKGKNCQNDVYVYKVDYKGLDGKVYHKTGHVTLNR
ncbi:MAG: T9SS type B sorting domain-containing protein, partial [Bacteroidia bacterium]